MRIDLEPHHITRLRLISRKLQKLCLDNKLWKRHCFDESPWYTLLRNRRNTFPLLFGLSGEDQDAPVDALAGQGNGSPECPECPANPVPAPTHTEAKHRRWQKIQDMANWDPSYPGERVSWYDEYIQRQGPACVSWLQTPRIRDREMEAIIESRGLALYNPYDGNDGAGTMLAVSPLDDGSVCLWDVKGTRGDQGSIIGRSKPDILFIDGPSGQNQRPSKRIDTGVTECVSVDHQNHRAFFAVQSRMCF